VTRVLVLADTHVQPGGSRQLPHAVYPLLDAAELILHAGDVTSPDLLHQLGAYAPVEAVLGNNDHELVGVLPEQTEVDVGGYRIGIIHDAGLDPGRPARMRRRFPDADLVVFGHSHMPLDHEGADGQRLFNPGSSTWKRRAATHTVGWLEVVDGALVRHEIVLVDVAG
jgi:putative phosphoesterase